MTSHQFEVTDIKDQYGMGMPILSFEATSWRDAYETAFEAMGMRLENIKEEKGEL